MQSSRSTVKTLNGHPIFLGGEGKGFSMRWLLSSRVVVVENPISRCIFLGAANFYFENNNDATLPHSLSLSAPCPRSNKLISMLWKGQRQFRFIRTRNLQHEKRRRKREENGGGGGGTCRKLASTEE